MVELHDVAFSSVAKARSSMRLTDNGAGTNNLTVQQPPDGHHDAEHYDEHDWNDSHEKGTYPSFLKLW